MKTLKSLTCLVLYTIIIILYTNENKINAQESFQRFTFDVSATRVNGKNWINDNGVAFYIAYGKQFRVNPHFNYGLELGAINYFFSLTGLETDSVVGAINWHNTINGLRLQIFTLTDEGIDLTKYRDFFEISLFADYYYRLRTKNKNIASETINASDYFKNYNFGFSFIIGIYANKVKVNKRTEFAFFVGVEGGWLIVKNKAWIENYNFMLGSARLGIRMNLYKTY